MRIAEKTPLGQPASSQPLPGDYDISDMLVLMPTSECKRVLQNLYWVFRPQRQGATIFAEVDQAENDVFHTKIPINRPYYLTFWLVVREPRFANFTNLPFTSLRDRIYYFSNLSGNLQGQTLFLTQPLPSYDRHASYR